MEQTEAIREIREWERGFPERIRRYPGMPGKLYYIGNLPPEGPAVSIVGARRCTAYGRAKARELGRFLAEHGVSVISGMAEGIDGYAHEGAILGGGRTYAVLGSGPDVCYPRSHYGLREAILRSGGGLLSEYEPGQPPYAYQFPARNRIISALADVVIVVEARKKSGSLITADFALEQGKTVLAFPGRFGDPLSEGTNALIEQGAGIVASFAGVLLELWRSGGYRELEEAAAKEEDDGGKRAGAARSRQKGRSDSPEEKLRTLLTEDVGYDPVSADELLDMSSLPPADLHAAVLSLLLDGTIREVSPGIYVLQ